MWAGSSLPAFVALSCPAAPVNTRTTSFRASREKEPAPAKGDQDHDGDRRGSSHAQQAQRSHAHQAQEPHIQDLQVRQAEVEGIRREGPCDELSRDFF